MHQYLDLLEHVLETGTDRMDRTGTGTRGVLGYQMRFDLSEGFPMVTTKKLHRKSIVHELLWFIAGDTNIAYLKENGVRIWDEWADENGDLGPVYGKQWRRWEGPDGKVIDQLTNVIEQIKTNPYSRRHMVSAWNPAEVEGMALPPCHCLAQFYVHGGAHSRPRLSCQLYQRSGDLGLGVPFNIASYAILTHMIAQVTGMQAGELVHTIGDAHVYLNHVDALEKQLKRKPLNQLPTLHFKRDVKDIDDFEFLFLPFFLIFTLVK